MSQTDQNIKIMPQLDLSSYFSAASTLVIGFLLLVFILNNNFLPKIASALKFRKKILEKQLTENSKTTQDNWMVFGSINSSLKHIFKNINSSLKHIFKNITQQRTVVLKTFRKNLLLSKTKSFLYQVGFAGLFIMEPSFTFQKFLSIFSYLSIGFTILYVTLRLAVSLKTQSKWAYTVLTRWYMKETLFWILLISRYYHNLPLDMAKSVSLISGILSASSLVVRFYVMLGFFQNAPVVINVYITVCYLLFLLNAIFRVSANVGYALDVKYPNITLVLGDDGDPSSWEKISEGAKKFRKYFSPQNTSSNAPQNPYLRRYGVVFGLISLPLMAWGVYEAHETRVATQDTAVSSKRSAVAAEEQAQYAKEQAQYAKQQAQSAQQQTDAKAVNYGLLSKEEYNIKYPSSSNTVTEAKHKLENK